MKQSTKPYSANEALLNVPMLTFGISFLDLECDFNDIETMQDLEVLREYGFNFQYDRRLDLWRFLGDHDAKTKLLYEELDSWLLYNEYMHELHDYAELKWWNEEIAKAEILDAYKGAMDYAEKNRIFKITIEGVIDYLYENYKLTDKEYKQLEQQRWEDVQERKHPDAK